MYIIVNRYISGVATNQHEQIQMKTKMDKYNYTKSQNVSKLILYNLINFYKRLPKKLKCITIIRKL